ncbi:MAG: M28 family peptidase [Gammaproteobacteria bacterium]|nr:M28 family peptidase [Gammaproteobacteria bacterium]
MSKSLKVTLWVLGSIAGVAVVVGLFVYRWAGEFETERVTDDLHVIYGNLGGNVAVLRTGEGALIVDTMTFVMHGEAIRDLAEDLTGEKVAVIVNSHWHFDHTHGNPAFDGSERIVSTARTLHHLETLDKDYWHGEAARGLPNETFEHSRTIRMGNKTVHLVWPGRGHTDGDLVALFEEDRTVHMGDLFFNRLYPNIDLESGGSVQRWGRTLDHVLALDFDRVIPGHGPLTDRERLGEFQAFVENLAAVGREAAQQGWSLEETVERGALTADADFEPMGFGPIEGLNREFVIRRAWEEATGALGAARQCGPEGIDAAMAHADTASPAIVGEEMRAVVAEIASDAYEGRGPGSAGDLKARQWIAARLAEVGIEPGGTEGYEQPFELVSVTTELPDAWTFSTGYSAAPLSGFVASVASQRNRASLADAELVFVGYGIQAPEYDWDDYKGQDMGGKVLVMLNSDPHWDADLFAGERRLYYGRWTYKYEVAARLGAAGAIVIHTDASAGYPWQVIETSLAGPRFELPHEGEPRLEVAAWLTETATGELLASAGHDLGALTEMAQSRDFAPVPLGIRTSLDLNGRLDRVGSANVIGVLPGSDERLRHEAVVVTAHHDHIGKAADAAGGEDVIYNGALDNASGVAQVLSLAKALAALPEPPRRSIVFALVGAEEQGLLGSRYYARHPTFPAGRISANVNFDGASIWGEARDIIFVGLGKSSLDAVASNVACYLERTLKGDQFPDRGYFYRSDQFSFARIGVPGIYLDGGVEIIGRPEGWGRQRIDEYTANNYHQPSDELTDDWKFDGMVADTRFGLLATWLIAQADEMQAWNAGDEFAAARAAALEELPREQ